MMTCNVNIMFFFLLSIIVFLYRFLYFVLKRQDISWKQLPYIYQWFSLSYPYPPTYLSLWFCKPIKSISGIGVIDFIVCTKSIQRVISYFLFLSIKILFSCLFFIFMLSCCFALLCFALPML